MLDQVPFPINWETINAYAAACSPKYLKRGVKFTKDCRLTKINNTKFDINRYIIFYKDFITFDFYDDNSKKVMPSLNYYWLKVFESSPMLRFGSMPAENQLIFTLNSKILYRNDSITYDGIIINYVEEEREKQVKKYLEYLKARPIILYMQKLKRCETYQWRGHEVLAKQGLINSLETINTYLNTSYSKTTKKDFLTFMRLMYPGWEDLFTMSPLLSMKKDDLPSAFQYALNHIKENK